MSITVIKLDSGIRYAFRRVSSPVAYCALTIKAGTRDEKEELNGVAHLVEHMLFKGTKSKGAKRINNLLESLGGELNAYTTKEETVIHATVLKEDISKAVELLSDLAFNSIFPEKELLKERDIVLEEIDSYKDTPSEQIFDDFDSYIFDSHPLSKPILGTPKSVKKLGVSDVKNFVRQNYHPFNMSFSIVADISAEKGATLVNRYFGEGRLEEDLLCGQLPKAELYDIQLTKGKSANLHLPEEPHSSGGLYHCQAVENSALFTGNNLGGTIKKVSKKTHQAHCVMGSPAYTYYDDCRVGLALLTNIVGGPALNSRLNQSLREKYALVYTVDASYTPYSDTGLFTIYFGADKGSIDKAFNVVRKELDRLIEKGMSETSLKSAKKQLLGQLAIANDNAEARCLSMGKSLLVFNDVETMESLREKIWAVTASDIRGIAEDILGKEKMFTLIYV